MGKKSGVGKLPDNNDFKPKKIGKFGSQRESYRTSFKVPKPETDLRNLDDRCGFNEIEDNQDLLDARGRKTGDLYFPDPIETTNYNSQAIRYERSLDLIPDKTYKDGNGRTVYAFCSKNSPTDFWEVSTVGGTFLTIPNPALVIICPRPFAASELLGVISSDGTTFRWSQLQGRATIVSPTEGDASSGVLNPFISIIGAPSTFDPPILLLLELLDNPLIFRIVQIVTTPTSENYGKDVGSAIADLAPEFKVTAIIPAPDRVMGAAVYRGEAISATWNLPANTVGLNSFSILQNTVGSYDNIATLTLFESRRIPFAANGYYQIQSHYLDQFDSFSSRSETFIWQFPIEFLGRIFADETFGSKSVSVANEVGSTNYQLTVVSRSVVDTFGSKSVSVANEIGSTNYRLTVDSRSVVDTFGSKSVSVANEVAYTNYQLGGVVIG